jgi:uncharacterized membrane protein YedE/YeeE
MMKWLALLAGTVFGLGLSVSGMIDPAKVINFLDFTGHWDPTLALVMGGAVLVSLPAFLLSRRRSHPLLAGTFQMPTSQAIDRTLLTGAAIFGLGWGLGGFCPGPAVAALGSAQWQVAVFVLAMIAGQWAADQRDVAGRWFSRRACEAGAGSRPVEHDCG